MRKHIATAAAATLLNLLLAAAPAAAQDDDDEESVAAPTLEPANYEVLDLTKAMRTDVPLTMERADDGTLYIGTLQGRIYRSRNGGHDWDERTVMPQLKALYGFPGQTILLGHVRSDSGPPALPLNLFPGLGVLPGRSPLSTALLQGLEYQHIVGSVRAGASGDRAISPRLGSDQDRMSYKMSGGPPAVLGQFSQGLVASSGLTAGAGLSARAPRLSILQRAKRLPVAAMNLQVLLLGRKRITNVQRIAIDPNNQKHLFAATKYGLYESRDGSDSWVRIFPGLTKAETDVREIYYDPHRKDHLYMGTGKGMYVSDDNGLSFTKHGFVPEVAINKVAVDPTDGKYIYVATTSGMYRSTDGGETFGLAYYSTIYKQRTLFWVEVDATDPNRVYLGSADGVHFSDHARTVGASDWTTLNGLRTLNLWVPTITTCASQPGLIYAQTAANLPTNLYYGNGPEAYLLVSRDYGKTFKVALANRSFGTIGWFTVDPTNCNRVWVLFSNAVLELTPTDAPPGHEQPEAPRDPDLPSMSEVLEAALKNYGVELDEYSARLNRLRWARFLPTRLNVTGSWTRWELGSRTDDFQFAEERYLARETYHEWRLTAWASWDLPNIYYNHQSIPLLRERVHQMNEEMRRRAVATTFRHYRELLVLRSLRRAGQRGRTLAQRAADRALEHEHIAVVDLATGGFLRRWIDEHKASKRRREK